MAYDRILLRHEWQCVSVGLYDSTYKCSICSTLYTTQMDNPDKQNPPENGCIAPRDLHSSLTAQSKVSDGSTASYYQLPLEASELQHLISDKDMNAQIGEIFRACYRYGEAEHSPKLRDAKKIRFYIEAEIARLEQEEEDNIPFY